MHINSAGCGGILGGPAANASFIVLLDRVWEKGDPNAGAGATNIEGSGAGALKD
jgi:hypothetical protein